MSCFPCRVSHVSLSFNQIPLLCPLPPFLCNAAVGQLQTRGPVEWLKEIEDAIGASAKFVAFIDSQYLCSHTCIIVRALMEAEGGGGGVLLRMP